MRNFKRKVSRIKAAVSLALMIAFAQAMAITAFAADADGGNPTGDAAWTEIVTFIRSWIPRLGGAIIIIGLIMFGMGWQRDDAEGRTRGIQVTIGGAIVTGVGFLVPTFMA
jgi:hypothetical protein